MFGRDVMAVWHCRYVYLCAYARSSAHLYARLHSLVGFSQCCVYVVLRGVCLRMCVCVCVCKLCSSLCGFERWCKYACVFSPWRWIRGIKNLCEWLNMSSRQWFFLQYWYRIVTGSERSLRRNKIEEGIKIKIIKREKVIRTG